MKDLLSIEIKLVDKWSNSVVKASIVKGKNIIVKDFKLIIGRIKSYK